MMIVALKVIFRWQSLPKVTKVKICSGLWVPIRGFSLTIVAPWVGHIQKLAAEYIGREHDFIEHIAKQRFVRDMDQRAN
jgi:hypothetical protein